MAAIAALLKATLMKLYQLRRFRLGKNQTRFKSGILISGH